MTKKYNEKIRDKEIKKIDKTDLGKTLFIKLNNQ